MEAKYKGFTVYILQLNSVHLYMSRAACAKKHDNTVCEC